MTKKYQQRKKDEKYHRLEREKKKRYIFHSKKNYTARRNQVL